MTSVVLGVKVRLGHLERKLRDARGACERNSLIGRELGQLKSVVAGVESRCREQKGVAAALVAETRSDRHHLVAKVAVAEERAGDFMAQMEYLRRLLPELQAALYAAEKAARDTAGPL